MGSQEQSGETFHSHFPDPAASPDCFLANFHMEEGQKHTPVQKGLRVETQQKEQGIISYANVSRI